MIYFIDTSYFEVDTDLCDDRGGIGADCVQLHRASNIRTITVWARVTMRPRFIPLISDRPVNNCVNKIQKISNLL